MGSAKIKIGSQTEISEHIHNKNWTQTSLGPLEEWPQSLRSALNVCLASNSPASICWGSDLSIIYNDAWKNLLGDKYPSSLGQPARQFFEDNGQMVDNFEEVLSTGEVKEVDNQHLTFLDGTELDFDFSFNPIPDKNGAIKGVLSIAREDSENGQSRTKLEKNAPEFADFFEKAPIGLHWLASDGTILKVNQAELDMLGYTREEYVGSNIADYHVDKSAIDNFLQKLSEGVELHDCEVQMRHKDGSVRDVSISSNVSRKEGEFIHTRCFTRDITEHKHSERVLRQSEERYRTLVDNFPNGAVGLFDENLRYTAIGGEFLKTIGVTPEERIGNTVPDIYPKELVDEFEPYFRLALEGEANSFELEYMNRNLFVNTLPIQNGDGEVAAGMLVVQDITERKQAQRDLRESEKKFGMIAENLNEVIWMASADAKEFIYLNPAFEKIWEMDREELYNDPWSFLKRVHHEDRERVKNEFMTLGKNGFYDEFRIVQSDGTIRWIYGRGTSVHDEEGNVTRVIGIGEDITERKQAEQKLRKNRIRLRTALEIDTVGVVFWNVDDFTITQMNDAFLEMSGYSRDELLGKTWQEFTPKEFYPTSEQAVKNLRTTGHTEPYEKQYFRKDGTRWWGLFAPRRIDENEAVEFVLDVTERRQAKEKLELMNEALEDRVKKRTKKLRSYHKKLQLLASKLNKAEELERERLATELHDKLGQMLTVAKMKVDGLLYEKGDDISTEIEGLRQVVNDALRYNQNLMVELKPPPALDKEDVTEVLLWTAKKMEKQGLKITVDDDGMSKPVDKEMRSILHQSVRELFVNTLKHADVNEARMVLRRMGEQVKVTVEDSGQGFNIKENSPVPTDEGGFGLFNIQERVDWHGGTFDIQSAPGQGTKATLVVPVKEKMEMDISVRKSDEALPPIEKTDGQMDLWQKVRVLLVDDHDMVRRGLRQMIERQDDMTIIAEASNGQEAVDLAHKFSPDVIVMDVNMPVLDGIEATQKINAALPNIRIIGLSLHDSQEVIDDMRSAGASAYLTKNEAFETLCATIRAEASVLRK